MSLDCGRKQGKQVETNTDMGILYTDMGNIHTVHGKDPLLSQLCIERSFSIHAYLIRDCHFSEDK